MVIAAHSDSDSDNDIDRAARLARHALRALVEFQALPAESQLQHGEAFGAAMMLARDALEVAFAVLPAEARERVEMLSESYRWN